VQVEVREGARSAFGLGRKVPMKFGDFVKRIAAGDTGLYLTAQQVRAIRGCVVRAEVQGGPEKNTHDPSQLGGKHHDATMKHPPPPTHRHPNHQNHPRRSLSLPTATLS